MDAEQMRGFIESVTEFEGGPGILSYRIRGHVDKDTFRQALLLEFGISAELEGVKHLHYRNVPAGRDMPGVVVYWPSKPGRGAYPVTEVDATSRFVRSDNGRSQHDGA